MSTVTQSFSSDATILEIRSVVPEYNKKAAQLIHQGRVMLSLMRKWGTIVHKDISWASVWNADTQLPQVSEWADDVLPSFEPGPNPIQFNLGDGSYKASDKLTEMQYLRMGSPRLQVQEHYNDKMKKLVISMGNKFSFEFLHGTGTGRRITGLDTILTLTGGTNVAADLVLLPDSTQTYAGQTLRPGARGGTWPDTLSVSPNANLSTDWPIIGNQTAYDPTITDYDATSPLIVNTTSSSWESGATWAQNAEESLRWYLSVNKQRGGMVADSSAPTVILAGEKRLREAKTYFSAKNYALLPVTEGMDWGMPATVNFEGAWLTTDSDVGSDMAYCIQPDMISYHTPQDDLWDSYGPEFKMELLAYLYLLIAIGKLRLQPKFFGALKNL